MPSGASKPAPHAPHRQPAESAPWHAGQASNAQTRLMRSEDRVDERRERLYGRRENQDQAEDAQKDRERHEPAASGLGPPQAPGEIGDRSAGACDHDQATVEAAAVFDDHAPDSFSDAPGATACFVTTADPATSTSIPQRRNVMYPSSASVTIGSPATLNEVLSSTGIPVRRPYASSSACRRGAISRSSTCTRAVPSTCVTAARRARQSARTGNTPDM